MPFFDWKEEYSVRIGAIDGQHKKIIELMNELFESVRDAREDLIIADVLKDLTDYASYHFGLEATLFKKYGYLKREEHLAEHRVFMDKIASLREEVRRDARTAAVETLDYLRDWFRDHMLRVDLDYSEYFASLNAIGEIEAAFGAAPGGAAAGAQPSG